MAYQNGIITGPVSIYDVQKCFGLGDNDLGTLILNADIKKWAKYKPVRIDTIDTVTGQWNGSPTNAWRSDASWWKAGGNCGLTFDVFSEMGEAYSSADNVFLKKLRLGTLPWTYTKPTASPTKPFRLQDFASYNHYAIKPFEITMQSTYHIQANNSLLLSWEVPPLPDYNLALTDFAITPPTSGNAVPLTEFYLGLMFYKSNGTTYHWVTSEQKFSTGDLTVNIADASSLEGTWMLVPFFSSVPYTLDGAKQAGKIYLSLGGEVGQQVVLTKQGSINIPSNYITAEWNSAFTAIDLSFRVVNGTTTARTGQTVVATIRRRPWGSTTSFDSLPDFVTYTWTNQTIPASSYLSLSRSITATYDQTYEYRVLLNVSTLSGVTSDWESVDSNPPM